jgi:hypothetical protein
MAVQQNWSYSNPRYDNLHSTLLTYFTCMIEFALQSTKRDARARVSATFIRLTSARKPIPDNLQKRHLFKQNKDFKEYFGNQILLL